MKDTDSTPIPEGLYWSRETDQFHDIVSHHVSAAAFYDAWQSRRAEFPSEGAETPLERAPPVGPARRVLAYLDGNGNTHEALAAAILADLQTALGSTDAPIMPTLVADAALRRMVVALLKELG